MGGKKTFLYQLGEMRPEPVKDFRLVFDDGEATEPLGANVVIALCECKLALAVTIEAIGEVEEQPHVEGLADGAKADHQAVIETGEMVVAERGDDGISERDGAGLDRVAGKFSPFDPGLGKDVEPLLNVPAGTILEVGADERGLDLNEGAGQLLAVGAAPILAAGEAHQFALGECNLSLNRPAVVGMFLDQRDEYFVRQRSRLAQLWIGANDDAPVRYSPVDLDLADPCRGAFRIMAKQCAGNTQQSILHVELVELLTRRRGTFCTGCLLHT